jgi:hypothetical protein
MARGATYSKAAGIIASHLLGRWLVHSAPAGEKQPLGL